MNQVINIILIILQTYLIFISFNIFLTWIPNIYNFQFFRVCRRISDWYLGPFHGAIVIGSLDFTPIIGIMLYEFILGFAYNAIR